MIGKTLGNSIIIFCILVLTGCASSYRATLKAEKPAPLNWNPGYTFSENTLGALRAFGINDQEIPDKARYELSIRLGATTNTERSYYQLPASVTSNDGIEMMTGMLALFSAFIFPVYDSGTTSSHALMVESVEKRQPVKRPVVNAQESFFIPANEAAWVQRYQQANNEVVAAKTATLKTREVLSVWLPLAWLVPGKLLSGDNVHRYQDLEKNHQRNNVSVRLALNELTPKIAQEDIKLRRYLKTGSPEEHLTFVKQEPWGVVHGAALKYAIANHQKNKDLAWHAAQRTDIPDYRLYLPDDLSLYFQGPENLTPWDLSQRLKNGEKIQALVQELKAHETDFNDFYRTKPLASHPHPVYRSLYMKWADDNEEVAERLWRETHQVSTRQPARWLSPQELHQLKSLKLPDEILVAYGLNTALAQHAKLKLPATDVVASKVVEASSPPKTSVDTLVLNHNSGPFISPYLANGMLSPWVAMALTPPAPAAQNSLGKSAARAAGSEIGGRLAQQFGGGFLGGLAGRSLGASAASSVVGTANAAQAPDANLMRPYANQSFNSMQDMGTWLKATHSDKANFFQAVDALDKVYPGFKNYLYSLP